MGDITDYVPDNEADVAVLEEPEHLTWFHHGKRWTHKLQHVVGIIHTNYLEYARREKDGDKKEVLLRVNAFVARAHCHKIIKLSMLCRILRGPSLSMSTAFHRTSSTWAASVAAAAKDNTESEEKVGSTFGKGKVGYFIGKVVWAKGYLELLERVKEYNATAASKDKLIMDVFGDGDDFKAVKDSAARQQLALTFHGRADHAGDVIRGYKFFINPSLSDVVATTTAEALAMGKFVVCARHPLQTSSFRPSRIAEPIPIRTNLLSACARFYTVSQSLYRPVTFTV